MIIMWLHAIGHFENWIIYQWYKWMNVFEFELKVINEKVSFWLFFFLLFLLLFHRLLAQLGTVRKKHMNKRTRKKKKNAKLKWQYCLCIVQFLHDTVRATCRARACASTAKQQQQLFTSKVGKLCLSFQAACIFNSLCWA